MTKLTQNQRLVLSSACDHELGLATRPVTLKPVQAIRMAAFFAENQLAKKIRAKADGPVWREDEQGRGFALKVLKAGRAALDSADEVDAAKRADGGLLVAQADAADSAVSMTTQTAGPKSLLIIGLMRRPDGATIEDLTAATGWLPHTTRAALSGLRKKGIAIQRQPAEQGRASVYRIAAGMLPKAA